MMRIFLLLIFLLVPAIAQDPEGTGCYFTDPVAREKSDELFHDALKETQSRDAPLSWEKFINYLGTGKFQLSQIQLSDAANAGNPHAILYLCLRGTPRGPRALMRQSYAWCRIGKDMLSTKDPEKVGVFNKKILELDKILSGEEKETSLEFEQLIRLKLKCK